MEVSHQTTDAYNPTKMPTGDMFILIPGSIPAENNWGTFSNDSDFGQALICPHCEQSYADSDGYIRTFQFDDAEIKTYSAHMKTYGCDVKFIEGVLGVALATETVIDPIIDKELKIPEQNVWVCGDCGKACKSLRGLQIHQKTHKKDK
jgi:hypothetical protein